MLSYAGEEPRVVLSTGTSQQSLKEAERIVLRGQGYATEDEARKAGHAWRSVLERVFAALRIGADFGDRAPKGGLTLAGKKLFEDVSGGQRFLNDDHGLRVYETDPAPTFVRPGPAVLLAPASLKRIQQALPPARSSEPTSPAESIAFELFSASLRTGGIADARFMLLMMALETLIDQQPRNAKARRHVDALIDLTDAADLAPGDRESIRRVLEGLKNESIGRAGRRLVANLGDRTYAGLSPRDFLPSRAGLPHVRHHLAGEGVKSVLALEGLGRDASVPSRLGVRWVHGS